MHNLNFIYVSDDSRQDVSTTHAHIIYMLKKSEIDNKLNANCTIWESIDGYCKQYRCSVSLYFLSLLSSNFNITINRTICTPEY